MSSYPAFSKWLQKVSGGDVEVAAIIIYNMIAENPLGDNLAWDLLRQTGDESYTRETFRKAAEIALKAAA